MNDNWLNLGLEKREQWLGFHLDEDTSSFLYY